MKIDLSKRIADIVTELPAAESILQKFGIDHRRAGNLTLDFACREADARLDTVVHSLQQIATPSVGEQASDWNQVPLADLMKHIVERHHAYCREELGRIEQLLNNVVRRHGERHAELRRIQSLFLKMGNDLKQHLLKEEQTLFPMIARLEEARIRGGAPPRLAFGTIAHPIRMMILEHDTGNRELDEIRKLTSSYQVPSDEDRDCQELLQRLKGFEQDMKQHVFLEDGRLFPRAVALEEGGVARASAHS
jgi:regulator of cell morphogenesis and NO signaling